jgi:polyphosphate kinase 2 (PPK2 family)
MLAGEGTRILKFLLHISRAEQLERLRGRLDDPAKTWKFLPGDLRARERGDASTGAYAEAVPRGYTPWAPWYIAPSDKNRPRDFLLAEVLVHTLDAMAPRYPAADPEVLRLRHTFT